MKDIAEPRASTGSHPPGADVDGAQPLRFRRSAHNTLFAGVAAGIGERIGVDPAIVRAAFVVLSLAAGAGALLYLVAWSISEDPGRGVTAREPTLRQALAFGCIVLGVLLLLREAGLWLGDTLGIPVVLAVTGWAVIYARSGPQDRARLSRVGSGVAGVGRDLEWPRVLAGAILVLGGMAAVLATGDTLAAIGPVLVAIGVTAAGMAVIFGPMVARLIQETTSERRERIRSEERAEMAAHLHDSVLQTLALIQRDPDASRRTVSLARQQERELRAWLYGRKDAPDGDSLARAVEDAMEQVEASHDIPVEVVVVGDAPLDERATAVVHACREAATNAARHAADDRVAVYVEVEPGNVTAFVRDRGKGFDPDHVPPDRRGIADSIRGRVQRYGGRVTITSRSGEGTEVQIEMPL